MKQFYMRSQNELIRAIQILTLLSAVTAGQICAKDSSSGPVWYKFDDRDPGIIYSGPWDSENNIMCYRGSQHISMDENSEMVFTFYGYKLRIYGGKDANRGAGIVFIDRKEYGKARKSVEAIRRVLLMC